MLLQGQKILERIRHKCKWNHFPGYLEPQSVTTFVGGGSVNRNRLKEVFSKINANITLPILPLYK